MNSFWMTGRVPFLLLGAFVCLVPVGSAVSVKDFGARGDGLADDTPAIEAAVKGATDGVVEFPRGSYRLTRSIEVNLSENGTLGLVGRGGSAKVLMAGAGPAFRIVGSHATGSAGPDTVKPLTWAKERMPLVDALEIVGEHPQADGLEIANVMQPILRSLLIRGVRHGVHFVSRSRNVLVADCHVYNCAGIGIFLDAVNIHQINISDSHISYCRQGGIKISASEIRDLQITGNDIEYNCDPKGPPAADIWIDSSQRSSVREGTIAGNTLQAIPTPGGANIRFTGLATNADKVGLFSIAGNHISNQEVNIHLDHARGVSISGNTFVRGYDRNLVVEASRNVVISGNVFDHNPDYFPSKLQPPAFGGISIHRARSVVFSDNIVDGAEAGTPEAGGAVSVVESREITIGGCQILNPRFRGIHLERSSNVRVTNCLVTEEAGNRRMLAAIEIAGAVPGTVVQGNSVGLGKNGDVVNRGAGAAVEGNRTAAVNP